MPHALLALSTALSALLNATLLYRGLRRAGVFQPSPLWRRLLPQVLVASLAMAGFLWWASGDWAAWTERPTLERALSLALAVGGGGAVYFAVLWLAGARARDLKSI